MGRMKDLLGDRAFARRSDPGTSHEAAKSLDGSVTDLEEHVLIALRAHHPFGMILDELVDWIGLDKVTISPRLKPLCKKGLVTTCGKRPGKSGRGQTIWILQDSAAQEPETKSTSPLSDDCPA